MFACLYAPDFSVQAALLLEPTGTRESLRRSPLVVLDGPANLLKVVALNDPARHIGIEVGMTKLVEYCCESALKKAKFPRKQYCWNAQTLSRQELSLPAWVQQSSTSRERKNYLAH